jgi:hypothetical protein
LRKEKTDLLWKKQEKKFSKREVNVAFYSMLVTAKQVPVCDLTYTVPDSAAEQG